MHGGNRIFSSSRLSGGEASLLGKPWAEIIHYYLFAAKPTK